MRDDDDDDCVSTDLSNCRTQQQWIFSTYKSLTCIFCTRNSEGGEQQLARPHNCAIICVMMLVCLVSKPLVGRSHPNWKLPILKFRRIAQRHIWRKRGNGFWLHGFLHDMLDHTWSSDQISSGRRWGTILHSTYNRAHWGKKALKNYLEFDIWTMWILWKRVFMNVNFVKNKFLKLKSSWSFDWYDMIDGLFNFLNWLCTGMVGLVSTKKPRMDGR